jgi:hypothetical protein
MIHTIDPPPTRGRRVATNMSEQLGCSYETYPREEFIRVEQPGRSYETISMRGNKWNRQCLQF